MRYSKTMIVAMLWSCMTMTYAQQPAGTTVEGANGVIANGKDGVIAEGMVSGGMAQAAVDAQTIVSYWTPAKMANAKPVPMPAVIVDPASLEFAPVSQESGEQAVPGYSPGCRPNVSNCNTAPRTLSSSQTSLISTSVAVGDLILPLHGTAPANPKNGPYGPFQRWREAEPIINYPKSTVGKLFFTLNGSNFVCSASVINRSTLITAGHCNSDGSGHFATNRLFCPSYLSGPRAGIGCWSVVASAISTRWHTLRDPDYDYSCLVTATSGTIIANKIGNVTGWLGRAWNFSSSQAERTFGYPQAAPFNGGTLQTTASTEWYTFDFRSGGQISKIIGSDLTGGASGGPWILGWTGGFAETADTDAAVATDPGSNWVNGVNSHKRCLGTCSTPPTTTSGVFWQEMSSPPFRNTVNDNGESEDVIALCLRNTNNL